MSTHVYKKERECKGSIRYAPVVDTIDEPAPAVIIYITRDWIQKNLDGIPQQLTISMEE